MCSSAVLIVPSKVKVYLNAMLDAMFIVWGILLPVLVHEWKTIGPVEFAGRRQIIAGQPKSLFLQIFKRIYVHKMRILFLRKI